MPTFHTNVEIEISRPPEDVWAVVSDYDTDTVWRKGILEMTPDVAGAPRVGTKVREVLHLGGRDYVTDTTVTEVGPDLSYRFAGSGTSGQVSGRRHVRPGSTAGSAVFGYDVALQPEGIPRIAQPLMARWLRHSLRRDVRRLRQMLES
jgi:hypothetical protein